MKCCRVFRYGFPRQSTTYRGFPLYSVFRDGENATPRWRLNKHAHDPRYVVENREKCKKKKKTGCAFCRLQRNTKYICPDKGIFKFYNRRPTTSLL